MLRKLIPCFRDAFRIIRRARRGEITEEEMADELLLLGEKVSLIVDREIGEDPSSKIQSSRSEPPA